ncbi:MAG: hypothetical protein LKJ88_02780 [Bacilli bacterium]|jgi:hypothetical protein|nr:hypothetical protein [Bacilli bacterium]
MRKKLIAIIFLLPIIIIGLLYSVSYVLIGNVVDEPDSISFAESTAFLLVGGGMDLKVTSSPNNEKFASNITYVSDREDILTVKDNKAYGLKSGSSQVTARYKETNITDTLNVFVYTPQSKELYIIDPNTSYTGITSQKAYGEYDLGEGFIKESGKVSLKAFDFGASLTIDGQLTPRGKAERANIIKGEGKLSYDEKKETYNIEILGGDDITVRFVSQVGESLDYTIKVIPEGFNVYTYAQLLYCTNHSLNGEKVVLRSNLESYSNSYLGEETKTAKKNTNPLLLTQQEKDSLKNLGQEEYHYLKRTYDEKDYYVEYLTRESTYDTRYLTRLNKSTKINIGLSLKKDLYANGFTINFHALTYPTGDPTLVKGVYLPSLSENDIFRGPLDYCGVLADENNQAAASVGGEDNCALEVEGDNLILSGLIVKNCNTITALAQLDYVGTVIGIKHQSNVKIEDSIIMNGRNLVRAFSNDGVTVSHCLLEYAKDFLLRLGADEFIQLTKDEFLSGGDYNYPDGERIGNTLEVDNTYFYDSGFFSIGLESHFNGRYLYDKDEIFSYTLPLGGISKGTDLTIKGDTRFYDWKDVDSISTDTMLQVKADLGDLSQYLSNFDIVPIIKRELAKEENKKFALNVEGKTYLNSAIADYGGGINNSVINSNTDLTALGLAKLGPVVFDPVEDKFLANCAGTAPFNFYLYPSDSKITYKDTPKTGDLAD